MKNNNENLEGAQILLVEDSPQVVSQLARDLCVGDFQVTIARSLSEALHLINTEPFFDALLSDLQTTDDGLTVLNAMRLKNPNAVTLMFSGSPGSGDAMDAILLKADEILIKPLQLQEVKNLIYARLKKRNSPKSVNVERVAAILERDSELTIAEWLSRVEREEELTCVPLDKIQRTGHLPKLLEELCQRLRVPRLLGTKAVSEAAVQHGKVRQSQGYSVCMMVEESRILQVSIFHTLQKNLSTVDFSLLLGDVMTIADECDSQLKQTINSFNLQLGQLAA